jgi:hydroxyethylthiazole kinase-like uncharacterized protein yjeF
VVGGGFMVKLFTVKEMQALEKEANENGLTYDMMMENAGRGIAEEIELAYSHLSNKSIVSLVGSGNNGGDALVALSYLSLNKWKTCAYIVRKRVNDDQLITRLVKNGGQVIKVEEDDKYKRLIKILKTCSILIDGVFGTGIKLPLKDDITSILADVKNKIENNPERIHVVAVDCPSGVDSDTGEESDVTIPAEITITMAGIKTGLIRFPAAKSTGELRIANIGPIENLSSYINNKKIILTSEIISNFLPDRPLDAHKGTFGTAFIIAGSINYTGAALLAGMAAYRSGAGLVTMAVPVPLHEALSGQFPESTWVLLPHEVGVISVDAARVIRQNINRATAVLVGPGFGLEDTTKEFLGKLFSEAGVISKGEIGFIQTEGRNIEETHFQKPIILDADGLKLMSKIPNWSALLPTPAILTPHPGEMSVLTGLSTDEIQENRLEIAAKYSNKWGHVVVLKGAFTVIAAPDGQIAIVPIASAALARAGTGDVLAGLIVGLRAQGVEAFKAACAGAWIHATAGVLAAKRLGNTASVIAGDVLSAIPQVISELSLK